MKGRAFERARARERRTAEAAVTRKLADAETPGARVPFDPDEAELAGAFRETALSPSDAEDAGA